MAQKKDSGVFQTEKGLWGYRFTLLIEGKRISRRKFTDSDGNKLTSKKQAVKAREEVCSFYLSLIWHIADCF